MNPDLHLVDFDFRGERPVLLATKAPGEEPPAWPEVTYVPTDEEPPFAGDAVIGSRSNGQHPASRTLTQAAEPALSQAAGVYRLTWPGCDLEARAVETSGHATYAIVTAKARGRSLPETSVNLTSERARRDLAAALDRLVPNPDWHERIDDAVRLILGAYAVGEPAVDLAELPETEVGPEWLAAPLWVAREPSLIFGDGGTHKSRTALLLAASVAMGRSLALGLADPALSGPVVYADWEQTARVARDRLASLCGGTTPAGVIYTRCARPFVHEAERLARIIMTNEAVALVIDSIGFALAGSANDDDSAAAFYRELRGLGVSALCIHHTPKVGDATRPYGSTYWLNGARLAWQATASGSDGTALVRLVCRKRNDGPILSPKGLSYSFRGDGTVTAFLGDAEAEEEQSEPATLRAALLAALADGPHSVAELAEATGRSRDGIRTTLHRGADVYFEQLDGGKWQARR